MIAAFKAGALDIPCLETALGRRLKRLETIDEVRIETSSQRVIHQTVDRADGRVGGRALAVGGPAV